MSNLSKPQRQRLRIYNKQKGKCIYCKTTMWSRGAHKKGHPDKMATFEHLHPKGMGGGKGKNLACSCSECNRYRGQIDHFKFLEIRKHKDWQKRAMIEKWKMDGIYGRKMRQTRAKELRRKYRYNHPRLYAVLLRCDKVIRFKNKHLHFARMRYHKAKRQIKQFKHKAHIAKHILRNKTKSLILNTFKQFEIQSFKPLSY